MAGVREYRQAMRHAASMRTLDAWYAHMEVEQVMEWIHTEVERETARQEGRRSRQRRTSRRRGPGTSMRVFAKRADEIDGELGSSATRR